VTYPLVIAHRGSTAPDAPENTLAAFSRAITMGADAIELDVHATADGAVVVHHDPVVAPTVGAPELAWRPLSTLTLAEVRRVRIGGTHPIPTLGETLDAAGPSVTLYVELKGHGVVERAAPMLAEHRGPVAMHSFDHRAVRRAAELAPNVPRGILVVGRMVDSLYALRTAKASALWAQHEYADESLTQELEAASAQLIAWTVNDPFEITRLADCAVHALCTDDVPAALTARQSTFRTRRA
jgi:glycerophosphoryl diester phosphodiesterase